MYVVTSCWFSHPFPEPDSVLIAEANKVVNFKIWTCHAVHFYIGLTMSVERKTGERMIRHFVYLRGGHFIYLRGGSKFANISASAGHAPRRGHLLLFECSLLPFEGSLSCCMKFRLQNLQPFFATVVDYACSCSRALSYLSRALSHAAWIVATVWDVWILLTAGPQVLSFVASFAICKVAKLPSCILFLLLSCTHRLAHLLVKGFCMFPKFPVPDCRF